MSVLHHDADDPRVTAHDGGIFTLTTVKQKVLPPGWLRIARACF
jgi:hypothetical protein